MDETLDLARLSDVFESDREAIVDVLRECSHYVRASVAELLTAARARDATGVSRAAHGIKGSCGNVGAIACERAASLVEAEARVGRVRLDLEEEFSGLLERLDLAIARYARGEIER